MALPRLRKATFLTIGYLHNNSRVIYQKTEEKIFFLGNENGIEFRLI